MDNRDNPIIIDGRNGSQTFGQTQTRTASSLLAQVLVITSVGFFTSAVGVWLAPISAPPGMFWLYFIVTIGLIFAIRAARNIPALAFGLFLLLALAMGFEIAPYINMLLHTGHTNAVFNAAVTTAVGMAVRRCHRRRARPQHLPRRPQHLPCPDPHLLRPPRLASRTTPSRF